MENHFYHIRWPPLNVTNALYFYYASAYVRNWSFANELYQMYPFQIIDLLNIVWLVYMIKMVQYKHMRIFCFLFDLILYVPSTIFQLNRDGSSWVKPVLS